MLTMITTVLNRMRNRHFLLVDVLVLCAAPVLAFILRTDAWLPPAGAAPTVAPALALYIGYSFVVRMFVFWAAGFYARYWRTASMDELKTLLAGNLLATLLVLAVFFGLRLTSLGLCDRWPAACALPRALPLIDSLLVLTAVAGARLGARAANAWPQRHAARGAQAQGQRVLVVGAGEAGAMIVDELRANPQLHMQPIGFADDDPDKRGTQIHGVPVLGSIARLETILQAHAVQHVIIAMPSAPGKVVRAVREQCQAAGVKTCIMPGLAALIDGTATVSQLRSVQIEDLLRRAAVRTDILALQGLLEGKRVLVTGGGGSIGRELCRQLLRCAPAELVVLGHGENSVFEIMQELQHSPGAERTRIRPAIADVRFADRILSVFRDVQPQIVFHAAAHKHVPLMEEHPGEAITNNILGTRNVVAAAQAAGVERFVMISTDKAVRPTSVMGASKRVAELIVRRAAAETGRPYVAVRFGNVLGSRGSVVLTFQQQIARGGPVTVTDPEMRRYFMTIPEAVQLVLQAAAQGVGGEVFMLEMGEPVKIVDLARDLIQLSGLQVGRDIDIVYTGMRPGEKLYEELLVAGEEYTRTAHPRIFSAGSGGPGAPADLDAALAALAESAQRGDRAAILRGLQHLAPEYLPSGGQQAAPPGRAARPALGAAHGANPRDPRTGSGRVGGTANAGTGGTGPVTSPVIGAMGAGDD